MADIHQQAADRAADDTTARDRPARPTGPRANTTRRTLIDLLKRRGPSDAAALAAALGVTAMAVRQHLYELQADGLVQFEEQPRPVGRPAKLWRLTAGADSFFPDGHADLTVGLIGAMTAAFGEAGMDRLLAVRSEAQVAAYRARLAGVADLGGRLAALAAARTEEGYMAEVVAPATPDGAWLLAENHCPICHAAAACTGLCRMELEVFAAVLGPDVAVARTDHILAGARRCAYQVTMAPADAAAAQPVAKDPAASGIGAGGV